jgi:hypothetical protein
VARRLGDGGVDAHLVSADVGHTMQRPLQDAIRRDLPWLLDGDGAAEP